jgi:hypothetical protein
MATGVASWSQTAATNATADSTVNFAEGQAPSSVNDSARALMASVAKYRDDHAGTLTTGGTSTAYTLTSNQSFASLTALTGVKLCVRFNATNGASPTLNVDGLGAKAIQTASGTAIPTGAILANSVHELTYDNSIPAWLMHGAFFGAASYSGSITPTTSDGAALGSSSLMWSDLFLASGGVINWNNGDVTVTHSANALAFAGASSGYSFDAAVSITGTLGVSSDFAVNTNKFTVAASSGNTVVAGTLAVTGATTMTGALAANNAAGVTAVNTVKAFGKVVNQALASGSFNVASFTDSGTSHAITFTTAMADTNYCVLITTDRSNAAATMIPQYGGLTTGGFSVFGSSGGVDSDPDSYSFMVLSTT